MTPETQECLFALRANTEAKTEMSDGSVWGSVYLPNARGSRTRQQFGGQLNALKSAGFYQPLDDYFGEVLISP